MSRSEFVVSVLVLVSLAIVGFLIGRFIGNAIF